MIEIKKLLETDNAKAKEFKKDKYIIYMSDINQPNLPWEEKSELLNIYETTLEDIRDWVKVEEMLKTIGVLS